MVIFWMMIFLIYQNHHPENHDFDDDFFDDDFDLAEIEDEQEDAEVKINREQKIRHVALALAELPQNQAKIIRMSFYDGLSHGEIAKQLELPLGTVKSRIRLAFGRLRKCVYLESGEMA